MNWIILVVAGLFETGFAFCLARAKEFSGTTAVYWYAAATVSVIISMVLLAKAAQSLPISTAYPVWTGIGAVGSVVVGILFFGEPATAWRIIFISLLIISVVGLKIVG